jgi:CHU_C Type IX secretion signal domain/PKD domain
VVNKKVLSTSLILLFAVASNLVRAQNPHDIIFRENKGQWPETVKFVAEIPGGKLFVEKNTLTYSFDDPLQVNKTHNSHLFDETASVKTQDHYAVKVKFINANSALQPQGMEPTPTKYNYFYGNNESRWTTGVKGYERVVINSLYQGIDLNIFADGDKLKYDLVLAPGANPACVQMRYDGATSLEIIDETLKITTPYQTLTEKIPASYALCDGMSRDIASRYHLDGETVSFQVGYINQEESVVIDPLLVFSTYSGSVADNWGNTATFDDQGNGYAGGMTNPFRGGEYLGEFPATSGAYQTQSGGGWDVAILKFDSAGQNLLYATHLGGSGTDVPQSMIVNQEGELLILGITGSNDFPVSSKAYDQTYNGGIIFKDGINDTTVIGGVNIPTGSDLFITKLSSDGSQLLASTYIGGSYNDGQLLGIDELARNYGDESRGDINFDSQGNIIIASRTASEDFPMLQSYDSTFSGGRTDGLLLKLSADLDQLLWSTFLGGNGSDVALSVKIDSMDNIFVAGGTTSADFPVTANTYRPNFMGVADGWVAHISAGGDSLFASTFIGTDSYDQTFFLDLDENEDVYVAGQTNGDYPISANVFSSGNSGQFIHKLSNDLQTSLFSTTINQTARSIPAISLTAFLVNECDNIYLAGWGSPNNVFANTLNNNFRLSTLGLPVTADAHQADSDGSSFYLMVLSGDASELLYATYLGDENSLVHVDGGTSRFDKHGIVYHSVCASCFGDSSFPTTEGAYSRQNGSTGCNNALFKFDLASLRARIRKNSLALDRPNLAGGCLPLDIVFENLSTGGEIYEWDFGDGHTRAVTTLDTIVHQYLQGGQYQVQLRAFDPNTCIAEDFAYTSVTVSAPNFSISEDTDICQGGSAQLQATGGTLYVWSPVVGLDNPLIANPVASPDESTSYKVSVFNANGCNYEDSLTINVIPDIAPNITIDQGGLCQGSREITILNETEFGLNVTWDMGDGTLLDDWQPTYTYEKDGQYIISGILTNEVCTKEITFNLNIQELHVPNVLTRNNDGKNDALLITAGGPVNLTIYTRWGTSVYSKTDYQNDWQGEGLNSGIYYYEVVLENNEVCNGWIHLLDGN